MKEKELSIEGHVDSINIVDEEIADLKRNKNVNFKIMKCKVISYNKFNNTLDVVFGKYGIRIKNVKSFDGNVVNIKYKGEIGKPNFEYKI